MILINTNIFEKFKEITEYDIQSFFEDFTSFVNNKYQIIVDFYTNGKDLTEDVLNDLDDLLNRSVEIDSIFKNRKTNMKNDFEWWNLIYLFEDCRIKLQTIKNSKKWFRSNKQLTYTNNNNSKYVLKQNETLSSLADSLGYQDPINDWSDIALNNDLYEEDYGIDSGNILGISEKNILELKLQSVLDGINGINAYGLDINKELTFEDDDISVLQYRDTILQQYKILLETTKGSVPEFLNDGINGGIIGSNINTVQYPVIYRQMYSLFSKDDTFKEFQILDISKDQDQVSISTQVKTRIGEVLSQNLEITV